MYKHLANVSESIDDFNLIPKNSGNSIVVSNSMPKSDCYILQPLNVAYDQTIPTQPICAKMDSGKTTLYIHSNNNTLSVYGSFSYPVAES